MPRATQNPAGLLDFVIAHKGLKNDAAFGRLVGLTPPQVSKMRHCKIRVTGDVLLQIHDRTTLALDQLRAALVPA